MYRKILALAIFLGLSPLADATTSKEDFLVKTTGDLIDLCTTGQDDPLYTAAVNFCHGYLVGAFHYYQASVSGKGTKPFVCFPDPPPSRNEAIADFIAWAQAHPQYKDELPVETEFRFLTEKWPCPQSAKSAKKK